MEYIETKRSILPSDVYVKNDAAVEAFPKPPFPGYFCIRKAVF